MAYPGAGAWAAGAPRSVAPQFTQKFAVSAFGALHLGQFVAAPRGPSAYRLDAVFGGTHGSGYGKTFIQQGTMRAAGF